MCQSVYDIFMKFYFCKVMLVMFACKWEVAFCITFTKVWKVNVLKVGILMLSTLLCEKK